MGDRSEWRDTASSGPRAAATKAELSPKQLTFREYMEHSVGCADCDFGNRRCSVAQGIWEAWRALPQ